MIVLFAMIFPFLGHIFKNKLVSIVSEKCKNSTIVAGCFWIEHFFSASQSSHAPMARSI